MTDQEFRIVEPPFDSRSRDATVAGVVLAAGTSSRFGPENKLLAAVDGDPLVRRAVEPLLDAGLSSIHVIVGHEADAVAAAVDDLPVQTVENPDYADGQASSVRIGIDAVGRSADGVVFALGDMPDVHGSTVEALVAAFETDAGDPVVAACGGERGNPVLFGRRHFERLGRVAGDTGGRQILRSAEGTTLVETGDPGVLRDVDRPGDV